MLYCLYRSSCENRPPNSESAYQCCNSCSSKTCTNRCKDDCKTCGLSADRVWIQGILNKPLYPEPTTKLQTLPKKVKEEDSRQEVALAEIHAKKKASEEAKKEARKRRREARKAKLKETCNDE